MPLPQDERIVSLANDLLLAFDKVFGLHPGFRVAHAKGVMLAGTFTPAKGAERLTRAPHVTRAATPVVVRFSNSTGLPTISDSVPDSNPRGLAVRFKLAEHVHTDIVSHSTDGFPTHTGNEFLELLQAIAASGPDAPSPIPSRCNGLCTNPKAFPFELCEGNLFCRYCFCFHECVRPKALWPISHRARRRQRLPLG
jgi:catalase